VKYGFIIVGIIVGLIVIAIGLNALHLFYAEGVSGESTVVGNSFVLAEFGYARGGRVLTYAIFRSFPTNSTFEQRNHDPRYQQINDDVFVRDNDGHMIPVGRGGMVYFFDGDHLRTIKVKAEEDDIGISGSSMEQVWANLQRFEVRTNN
jgi:hypothetical protein